MLHEEYCEKEHAFPYCRIAGGWGNTKRAGGPEGLPGPRIAASLFQMYDLLQGMLRPHDLIGTRWIFRILKGEARWDTRRLVDQTTLHT